MEEILVKRKLEHIEHDIEELKKLLLVSEQKNKKPVTLRGMFKGLKASEEDFEEAKKSLFPYA